MEIHYKRPPLKIIAFLVHCLNDIISADWVFFNGYFQALSFFLVFSLSKTFSGHPPGCKLICKTFGKETTFFKDGLRQSPLLNCWPYVVRWFY